MNWKANHNNWLCKVDKYVLQHFIPDYMVCYKTLLRPAEVWVFEENEHDEFESFVRETEEIYDELIFITDLLPGYQLPCAGDSGSGNWMKRDDMENIKHVLVGISSFSASGVNTHFCGLVYAFMEKINNADNMDWIKSHLELT